MRSFLTKRLDLIVITFLIILASLFIFWDLGGSALIDWDESIYAAVSKEILKTGDWLSLRWNRDLWFEKPPLYLWLTALTYKLFGASEFTARFWSAVFGVLGVVIVYFFGKNLFNRLTGFASAFILLTTAHWVLQSRNGTLDAMVSALIALTLFLFWRARLRPKFWPWVGISLGLVFMTKGAVAVIPLVVMLAFALLEIILDRNFGNYPLKGLLLAVGCLLIAVSPWHLVEYYRHGKDFIDEYFFYHILSRTKGIEGHAKPFFWYFVVLQHWARHWYLLFAVTLIALAYYLIRDRADKLRRQIFLFLWFFVTLLIFSLSRSKIQWYIIPIYPAMALTNGWLIALILERLDRERLGATLFSLLIFSLVLLSEQSYLWRISDYNRGIAEAAGKMREVSRPEDPLYVCNLAQGPPIFYSDRQVITIGWWGLWKEAGEKERIFILSPEEIFRNLEGEGQTWGMEVFEKHGSYMLYGRR